jgi:hypothetical protein
MQWLKPLGEFIFLSLFAGVALYLVGSLAAWDMSPPTWPLLVRGVVAALWGYAALVAFEQVVNRL